MTVNPLLIFVSQKVRRMNNSVIAAPENYNRIAVNSFPVKNQNPFTFGASPYFTIPRCLPGIHLMTFHYFHLPKMSCRNWNRTSNHPINSRALCRIELYDNAAPLFTGSVHSRVNSRSPVSTPSKTRTYNFGFVGRCVIQLLL